MLCAMERSNKEGVKQRLALMAAETGATRQAWADVCNCSPQAAQGWMKTGTISETNRKKLTRHYGYSDVWLQTGYGPKHNWTVIQKRIAEMMKRNGMYPEDVELLTGGKVSADTVEQWLRGAAEPTDKQLSVIAPHLGMPPAYFTTGVSTVKHHGGPDREVLEIGGLSPAARSLIELITAGNIPDEKLAAVATLLDFSPAREATPTPISREASAAIHKRFLRQSFSSDEEYAAAAAAVVADLQTEAGALPPHERQALMQEIAAQLQTNQQADEPHKQQHNGD